MDKSSKLYKKAVEYYNDGDLNKALEYCEKSISLSLNNSAALNLKGLLLYLRGELEEARNLWKLNKDHNRDEVSKKYLESLAADEEKLKLFKQASGYIESMEFREALALLKECASSDFNAINVGNALSKVYIHLGNYVQAKACIDKVLSINKTDKLAGENKKILIDYKVIDKMASRKPATIFSVIILIAAASWFMAAGLRGGKQLGNTSPEKSKVTAVEVNTPGMKSDVKAEKPVPVENSNLAEKKPAFPKEEIDSAIRNRDYNLLAGLLEKFKVEELTGAEREQYIQGKRLLEADGAAFFYSNARSLQAAKKFEEAIASYERAKHYGEKSYLYPNAIFMIGACYEAVDNKNKAVEYYTQYLNSKFDDIYKNNYNSSILYSLVMIYKDTEPGKARGYAEQIRNSYRDSIYNNSIVDSILK